MTYLSSKFKVSFSRIRELTFFFTGGSSSNRLAYLRTYDIENDNFDYLGTTSTGFDGHGSRTVKKLVAPVT